MSNKRKVKAKDIVNDIRSQMTDAELMAKYSLSAKGLQSVFEKLIEMKAMARAELAWRPAEYEDTAVIRNVDAFDIADDVRAGMADFELMEKYKLSPGGLEKAVERLVTKRAIDPVDLQNRAKPQDDSVFLESLREVPRHILAIAVDIYELGRPGVQGWLRDITDMGLGITGIEAAEGETKTFVVPTEGFLDAEPIVFRAKCVWSQPNRTRVEYTAGFQITSISPRSLGDLRQLIRCVSLGE